MVQIQAKPIKTIPLGHRGENEARQIIFDLGDYISTYGPGTARLLHQRDGDPAPYIVPAVQDGDTLAWTVTDEDTAAPGTGSAELQWTVNDVLAKSDIWRTKTTVALDDGATAPPTGAEGWYQQLIAYIDSLRGEGVSEEQIASAVEAYLLEHPVDVPVESVNGQTGAVQLTAEDVGAIAAETDPTVPEWAKAATKPSYTAEEVGARSADWMPTAADVGALPATYTPPDQTAEQVGADPAGTAASAVYQHNTDATSHNDLRLALKGLSDRINAVLDSDDATLDQMSEVVAYIKSNKSMVDAITTSKVNVSDIVNNLTTNVSNKPLSAAQGVVIKTLIDALRNDKLDAAELTNAVNTALAQAKASGEFDGTDGKSAYQYAQDGGYTGTEAEFAAKLAEEIPGALPNPNALTFTGAVTGSYDGSEPLTVEIPSGGSGGGGMPSFEKIGTIDLSTMAVINLGVEFTVTDVTEIVLIWTGATNTTTSNSSLLLAFNSSDYYNTLGPRTGKAGSPQNGYTYVKVLENVGILSIVSAGAISNTNYTQGGSPCSYNLIPVKEKIQTFKIKQPKTQYYADAGIVEVYVR